MIKDDPNDYRWREVSYEGVKHWEGQHRDAPEVIASMSTKRAAERILFNKEVERGLRHLGNNRLEGNDDE